jgi:hypothetical protein
MRHAFGENSLRQLGFGHNKRVIDSTIIDKLCNNISLNSKSFNKNNKA